MDRLLGWCGLNGRAFIPLLSSFACAVPGIMAARVMPDAKSRLATIMVAPLMSCSARLPVYVLLIGAFIEPQFGAVWAGVALFAMHFVGLLVAIPVVFVLNRGFLKGKRLPFTLELPRYQMPRWRDVGLSVYSRGRMFLQTAGTIIFAMSIVIWALLFFPRSDEAAARYRADYAGLTAAQQSRFTEENYVSQRQLRNSYLGRFGQAIEPAFVPAGFDWRLTTGILAAFPAREVVIPALGIIFSLGGDVDESSGDLRDALHHARWPDGRPLMTPWNAVSMMVFFALCCQCMATLATIKRETNSWKWPVVAFVYMTALAYLAAVAINSIGRAVS
jgi:ferrous iron transport protein B